MGRLAIAWCIGLLCSSDAFAGELHDATRRGDLATVEQLLAKRKDIDAVDSSGATPLYLAASEGHAVVVRKLLAAGANWRHQLMGFNGSTGTAIHAAARNGHAEVVQVLLQAGVDPNLPDDGVGPPLHVAREAGQSEVERILRAFGAHTSRAEPVDDLLASADTTAGERLAFACAVCHDLTKEAGDIQRVGPSLWGVVGRPKAGVSDYAYSRAIRESGGTWTYADLNAFIANPRGFLPGTKMRFRGVAEREHRAALIAYLRTRSDNLRPLP